MTVDEIHNSTETQGAAPYKRTIAIALDSSKFSEYAFNWALEHYLRQDDYVLLLNVQHHKNAPLGINSGLDAPLAPAEPIVHPASAKDESHALLTKYAKILASKEYAYKAVSIHPSYVSTKESIVREVAQLNATALIVGSRGADALSRGFIGSVSDYCAHHCHCPVVIAKPSEEEAKTMKAIDESVFQSFTLLPSNTSKIV
ncbi:adenine nucleotide alpha hydrolases-like protein [Rhizoclosmatium globosum]|uniref:Adenine nucleotide alpha hydrolases-like protein n=1 Tax=Rhizoclosmatium globosum TaxID=329046 RepID=A0A1Y2BKC6_9FUNG|nr:hypothetical protein HDU79_001265 [Rhizoclosmatium sp. JEL0117]ORY35219.1 adenine nucleotide alpha hydrolases-like protein [Rhizoclosmatium globosum]|eukprot:ORY35219.1 adenine nucleotide alpha hydrolases-like protein [Rhizoclosmatium globosum]